jgi:hypothetical protein
LLQNVRVEGTREVEWEYSRGGWGVSDVFGGPELDHDTLTFPEPQFYCPNCDTNWTGRQVEYFRICDDCKDRIDDSSHLQSDGVYRCESCQLGRNDDNVPEEAPPTKSGACDNCGMSQKPVRAYADETLCPECAVSRGCVQM